MHLRRLSILLSLGATFAAGAAVVYKWTDADGVVHYSDQAVPGAEKMVTSSGSSNGIGGSARSSSTGSNSARPATGVPTALPQEKMVIQSPATDQVFFGDDSVPVRLDLEPALKPTQTIIWALNGKTLDDQANQTAFSLNPLPRGTYSLTATVSDPATGSAQVTASVTFNVRQPSELAPLNPNRR